MKRRNKEDMGRMKSDCRYYLLQTNNKPQIAFELMVKEHLESRQTIPYYIKDIKDFIKVSQEIALELGRVEQMNKKDQEKANKKESVKQQILSLSLNEMKEIYKQYKDKVSQHDKINLVTVYTLIGSDELNEKDIDQSIINTFERINIA